MQLFKTGSALLAGSRNTLTSICLNDRAQQRKSQSSIHLVKFYLLCVSSQAATAAPKRVAVSDYMRRFCSHLGMNQKESKACIDVADNAVPREGTTR